MDPDGTPEETCVEQCPAVCRPRRIDPSQARWKSSRIPLQWTRPAARQTRDRQALAPRLRREDRTRTQLQPHRRRHRRAL